MSEPEKVTLTLDELRDIVNDYTARSVNKEAFNLHVKIRIERKQREEQERDVREAEKLRQLNEEFPFMPFVGLDGKLFFERMPRRHPKRHLIPIYEDTPYISMAERIKHPQARSFNRITMDNHQYPDYYWHVYLEEGADQTLAITALNKASLEDKALLDNARFYELPSERRIVSMMDK